jgi:hypothetical protein
VWEDNIKIDLLDMGWSGLDSSGSRYGPGNCFREHGNKLPIPIKY